MILPDKSNGYEQIARDFMRARNPRIGPETVREWSRSLPPGASVLDLGCGYGLPVTQVLSEAGFAIYGVDASPTLLAEFRKRFPNTAAECAGVEESEFFRRTFDAVIAWGLMFLLTPDLQVTVIGKVARALNPGGKFLFTSLAKAHTWNDSLTQRLSISLGADEYKRLLRAAGLSLDGETEDEGENHYYLAARPCLHK